MLEEIVVNDDAVGRVEWTVQCGLPGGLRPPARGGCPSQAGEGKQRINDSAEGDRPAEAKEGLGRSRGGLTSKVHLACDRRGRSLSIVLTPGQAHDGWTFAQVLAGIGVCRAGPVPDPIT